MCGRCPSLIAIHVRPTAPPTRITPLRSVGLALKSTGVSRTPYRPRDELKPAVPTAIPFMMISLNRQVYHLAPVELFPLASREQDALCHQQCRIGPS